ncbi:hypothetical protein V8C34DRAFT_303924 [Trichoderma compactum]
MTFKLPLLATKEARSDDTPSVLAIFGVQHPESLTPLNRNSIAALKDIFTLENSPGHVQIVLESRQPGNPPSNCNTAIFQAFWFSSTNYEAWWQSTAVSSFWNSLEENAGVWHDFESAFISQAQRKEMEEKEVKTIADKKTVLLRDPSSSSDTSIDQIRLGRVVLPHGIDNMLYVWEFQDHSQMTEREKDIWNKHINSFVGGWMNSLDKGPNGV